MITLPTLCSGCRYWHRVDSDFARNNGGVYYETYEGDPDPPQLDLTVGVCSLAVHGNKYKNKENLPQGWTGEAPRVVDGSGFFAALWTKADFGCIRGELREGAPAHE